MTDLKTAIHTLTGTFYNADKHNTLVALGFRAIATKWQALADKSAQADIARAKFANSIDGMDIMAILERDVPQDEMEAEDAARAAHNAEMVLVNKIVLPIRERLLDAVRVDHWDYTTGPQS